jgi:hypothetical protein
MKKSTLITRKKLKNHSGSTREGLENHSRTWASKRQPDGFCGGIFPHVYARPEALRDPGLCIFCGTPESVGVAAGDHGRRADW